MKSLNSDISFSKSKNQLILLDLIDINALHDDIDKKVSSCSKEQQLFYSDLYRLILQSGCTDIYDLLDRCDTPVDTFFHRCLLEFVSMYEDGEFDAFKLCSNQISLVMAKFFFSSDLLN